jgi:hypothetical protein
MSGAAQDIDKLTRDANKYAKTVKEPREREEQAKKKKEFKRIIKSEKTLLERFNPQRLKLDVVYNNELFQFTIRPLSGSDDLEKIGMGFNTYAELSDFEKQVLEKKNSDKKLTKKEKAAYSDIEDKLSEDMLGDGLVQAHQILASFLTPPAYTKIKDSQKRFEKKLEFWQAVPLDLKMYLFNEVIDRLGLNPESEVELFPTN